LQKILDLYRQYGKALRYLIIGGLTTLINVFLFFELTHLQVAWFWANLIAWVVSVAFAFVANKEFVFASHSRALPVVLREGVSFFALRLASLAADTVILFVGLTLLHGNPLAVKFIDQIIVVVLNYFFSQQIFSMQHQPVATPSEVKNGR
jgi:putative flippase GtrA